MLDPNQPRSSEKEYRSLYDHYGSIGGLSSRVRNKSLSLRANVLPHLFGRVLEVGCGQGELLSLCQEAHIDARGCDVSPEMVEACVSRGLRVELVEDTVRYLQSGQSWDTLVLVDVLEHMTRDEALALARVAQTRGKRLVVQVPNMASPFAALNFYHDLTHEWAYTESSMGQLLRLAGFSAIRVVPVDHAAIGLQRVRRALRRVFYAILWLFLVVDQPSRSSILTPNLLAVADVD